MDNLLKAISSYKKVTAGLLTKLAKVEEKLKEELPEDWYDVEICKVAFVEYKSKVGYMQTLTYCDDNGNVYVLPGKTKDLGRIQALHCDYNTRFQYANAKQVLAIAHNLPSYVNGLASQINDFNEDVDKILT